MLSNDPRMRRYLQPPPEKATIQFIVPGREPYVERLHLQHTPKVGTVLTYAGAQWQIVRRDPSAFVAELCFAPSAVETKAPEEDSALASVEC